jgi:multidrug resistance efflux pump
VNCLQARELYDDNLRLRKARHLLDTDLVECKAALHDARARLRNATAEAHRLQQLAQTATAAATAATKAIAPPGTVQVKHYSFFTCCHQKQSQQ